MGTLWIVRVIVDGNEMHTLEWTAPDDTPAEQIAIQVGRVHWHRAQHDVRVELRKDGEPWGGERYNVRPVFEAVSVI